MLVCLGPLLVGAVFPFWASGRGGMWTTKHARCNLETATLELLRAGRRAGSQSRSTPRALEACLIGPSVKPTLYFVPHPWPCATRQSLESGPAAPEVISTWKLLFTPHSTDYGAELPGRSSMILETTKCISFIYMPTFLIGHHTRARAEVKTCYLPPLNNLEGSRGWILGPASPVASRQHSSTRCI